MKKEKKNLFERHSPFISQNACQISFSSFILIMKYFHNNAKQGQVPPPLNNECVVISNWIFVSSICFHFWKYIALDTHLKIFKHCQIHSSISKEKSLLTTFGWVILEIFQSVRISREGKMHPSRAITNTMCRTGWSSIQRCCNITSSIQ